MADGQDSDYPQINAWVDQAAKDSLAVGQIVPGNIDLNNRPVVHNPDGSISTVRTIGVNFGGKEYVIPTVADNGTIMSDKAAIKQFIQTGRHFGAFTDPESATNFAVQLHNDQAARYGQGN